MVCCTGQYYGMLAITCAVMHGAQHNASMKVVHDALACVNP